MDTGKTIRNALRDKISTVSVDESLDIALKTMARDDATALLVKTGDEPVGIITISDIMYSMANEENPKEIMVSSFMTKCELITTQTVKTPCIQLDEDENILSAIKVMNEAGVSHVLVSGDKGEPVGMVSSLDIVKLLVS